MFWFTIHGHLDMNKNARVIKKHGQALISSSKTATTRAYETPKRAHGPWFAGEKCYDGMFRRVFIPSNHPPAQELVIHTLLRLNITVNTGSLVTVVAIIRLSRPAKRTDRIPRSYSARTKRPDQTVRVTDLADKRG